MKTERVTIANLKCSGCESTIIRSLAEIVGVNKVVVNPELDEVIVACDESTQRIEIVNKLRLLGYPEATEENGLLLQLKSYISCAIGRLSKV